MDNRSNSRSVEGGNEGGPQKGERGRTGWRQRALYLVDEYLVTPLVPSEMACLASSPGRMRRTDVWISRLEMVDFLLYDASLDASPAMRSKMSLTKELHGGRSIAVSEILGRRCDAYMGRLDPLENHHGLVGDTSVRVDLLQDLVDVGRVGLLTLLFALLLVAIGRCRRLLGRLACLASGGLCVRVTRDESVLHLVACAEYARCLHSLPALPPVAAGALPPVEAGALDAGLGAMFVSVKGVGGVREGGCKCLRCLFEVEGRREARRRESKGESSRRRSLVLRGEPLQRRRAQSASMRPRARNTADVLDGKTAG